MKNDIQIKKRIQIDMVSDVVCPWCAIGLHSLLEALEGFDDLICELHFRPFELSPDMVKEGEEVIPHLCKKYGMSRAQVEENQARITERGADLGFEFNFRQDSHKWNTFDAHRLLHWAQQLPDIQAGLQAKQRAIAIQPGTPLALKSALLKASFTDNRNLSDLDELARIAGAAGFDEQQAQAMLESGEFSAEVRAEEKRWQKLGISSVPAFVFDDKYMISGGQPPKQFRQLIQQLLVEC